MLFVKRSVIMSTLPSTLNCDESLVGGYVASVVKSNGIFMVGVKIMNTK